MMDGEIKERKLRHRTAVVTRSVGLSAVLTDSTACSRDGCQGMMEWSRRKKFTRHFPERAGRTESRAGIREIDVLGCYLHIAQSGFDVGMSHQLQ